MPPESSGGRNSETFLESGSGLIRKGEFMNNDRRTELGFNLIELMIVIAVIALLISISGYAWQVMIRRGNEAAAVAFVNKINTAQAYFASKHQGRFAASFRLLVADNLLDKVFDDETPVIDGYRFLLKTEGKGDRFFR